ncbi:hypothetical protein OAK75_03270 [Bacteriovoracales bacterium]|nr:hypothetical protein [Bacteriovoracales bacterium]
MFDYSKVKILLSLALYFFIAPYSYAQDLGEKDIKSKYMKICLGLNKERRNCIKDYNKEKTKKLNDCYAINPKNGFKKCRKEKGGLLRLKNYVLNLEKKIRARGRWVSAGERVKAKIKMKDEVDKKYDQDTKSEMAEKVVNDEGKRIKEKWKMAFSKVKDLNKSGGTNELKEAKEELKKVEKEKREFEKINYDAARNTDDMFYASENNNPCDDKKNSFIPLKLLKKMTWLNKGIEVDLTKDPRTGKRNLSVSLPDYVYKCFSPQVVVKKAEGNTILIAVKNQNSRLYEDEESDIQKKFEECLLTEGIDVDNPKDDLYNRPLKKKNFSSHIDLSKMDPSKDIRVVFGSPTSWPEGKYKPEELPKEEKAIFKGKDNNCLNSLASENLKKDGLYLMDWKKKKKELLSICEKGSVSRLEYAIKDLTNYPEKLVSDVRKILESQKEKKIEEEVELKMKQLAEYADEIVEGEEREDISESVESYLSVLRDLDTYFLRPKLRELDKLLIERKTSKNKDEIDKKISKLNEQIGRFSKGKVSKGSVEGKLKTKDVLKQLLYFGLDDAANEINLFRLHSREFSRVYKKKGKKDKREAKVSSKRATRLVEKGQARFEKESQFNAKLYKAMKGEGSFSHINRRNIKNLSRRRNESLQSFYKKEKKYNAYCQRSFFGMVKNANKCKRYQKGQKSRYLSIQSRIKRIDRKIGTEKSIEKKFRSLEGKARISKREEMGLDFKKLENDTFGDSLFEDSFMEGIYKKRLSFFGESVENDGMIDPFMESPSNNQNFNNPLGLSPNSAWGMNTMYNANYGMPYGY